MKKNLLILAIAALAFSCKFNNNKTEAKQETKPVNTKTHKVGTLEVIAEMDINPGNVAVSNDGRIFTTIHPLRATNIQLVEITGKNSYNPFPNTEIQSTADTKSIDKFDTPLGIIFDNKNRLWVIDPGLSIGKTRLYAFDITSEKELYRFDIPSDIAPKNSFVQDLAIDEKNDLVYLADFGNPGIIVVDIKKNTCRKITDPSTMQAEDIDMVIDGKVQQFMGNPARIAINPITLSTDRETLFFGAMSGTKWYQLPTKNIRNNANDQTIISSITTVGEKPISDGIATDENGNHYITNIQNKSIDVLTKDGKLSVLKQDELLDWPDNIRIHKDWLYISVNQLHKSPAFTGAEDIAKVPYRILKLKYRD
ncbi:L-dopachrome tautomerase-related protein [Aquimarina sediminis]|uniref:L-dopachrome tautomerase-related protein n=1 Tax=Aquimarina sediminis TaxID=2070536 RepID=UPI000CA0744A|nr:L-dopachrome tautomerase-related protein [Aquimarina sediminis]